jgi:hypothetical protein
MIPSTLRAAFLGFALLSAAGTPALAQVGKTVEAPETIARGSTYLTSAELRARAFSALENKLGQLPPVSRIEIAEDRITVWTQSRAAAYYTDSWTISRMKLLVFDSDTVAGPKPTDGDGIVARREGSFFDLSSVPLDQLEATVAAAIGKAGMEQRPALTSLVIARQIAILPEPHYGDVRWTIGLATPRETATVYADTGGRVIGADLSGTTRAQRLNLIADDDWPMAEAQVDIAAVLGGRPLKELRIYDTYVYFTAAHPTKSDTTSDYSWNLGGVRQGLETPAFDFGDTLPFAITEFDLAKLPQVKAAALAAFESPGATITYIEAEKPTDRAAAPQLVWSVDIQQADGEKGHVLLDASAKVLEVVLPESRAIASQGPWLAPEMVIGTLRRLEKAFGPDAKFGEILINDTQGSVLVEDPQAPGSMANFIIDPQRIVRFGTPMPWEAELNEAKAFRLADLASLDAAALANYAATTLDTMKLEGTTVFRYTFSRKTLLLAPDDARLLLEIRAGKDDGWTSGWVTFELDGTVADRMLP